MEIEWETVFKLVTAIVASIGVGGGVVFALSSWLGKVWANRILANEKHELGLELEKAKRELDLVKETTLRFKNDKMMTYRSIVDVVAKILATLDLHHMGGLSAEEGSDRFHDFNEQRIRIYGYLAMLAPQTVMDAQDKLMDHLLLIAHNSIDYNWEQVRDLSIKLLNEIRMDIGIDTNPIEYRGEL